MFMHIIVKFFKEEINLSKTENLILWPTTILLT